MRIAIISDEHFPHRGADTEVVVNTAAALGKHGAEVTLVVPWLPGRGRDDVLEYYGVEPTFTLAPLHGWPFPERRVRVEKLVHGLSAWRHPAVRGADVVHSRDLLPLLVAHTLRMPWSFETYRRHAEEKPWLGRWTRRLDLGRAVGAVAHSEASRRDLVELGFPEPNVVVARPGFAVHRLRPALERAEARAQLDLPTDRSIVGYAGNVYASKGTGELLDAAARMPETLFLVVGGAPGEVAEFEREASARGVENLECVGQQPAGRVAPYLFASDVLYVPPIYQNVHAGSLAAGLFSRVLPGPPFKIFSYLAAARPIVAADQPHNRELLRDRETALLVPCGDADATAEAMRRLLNDAGLAETITARGLEEVAQYTWDRRAEIMLAHFERRLAERGR